MSKQLEKIRERIRQQLQLNNIVAQSNGDKKPLIDSLAVVPVNQMWQLLQWLHETILPKIEQQKGRDSFDYQQFSAIEHAIVWGLYIESSYETVLRQKEDYKLQCEFYRQRLAAAELELQKFTAADAVLNSDAYNELRKSIINRAIDLLEKK